MPRCSCRCHRFAESTGRARVLQSRLSLMLCRQTRCLSVRSDPTVTAIVCNASSPLLRAACAWRCSPNVNGTFRSRRRDSSQSHSSNLCVYSVLNMFTSPHDAKSASTNSEKHAGQRRKHFVLSVRYSNTQPGSPSCLRASVVTGAMTNSSGMQEDSML